MSANDTIFAVASGAGIAALAVIRVSGPNAKLALLELAGRCPSPRVQSLAEIRDPVSGEVLDQAVIVWIPGPRSYTGEDSAEIHVHASRATITGVLEALGRVSGLRSADPGEFTRRAVLNGKMDLVEAEGLGDLLVAETSRQRQQALGLLLGTASTMFEKWRADLILIRSDIEAVLDFGDEDGVAAEALVRIDREIRRLVSEMEAEISRSEVAVAIRDGVKVVLAGLPNTGKSSLLNAVAGRDAAIVSSIPGTTRDVVEVRLDLQGVPVLLMDTAGLREGSDEIEREGIRRGRQRLGEADIVVWVMSADVIESDRVWPDVLPDLKVLGKADQISSSEMPANVLAVSTRTGLGMKDFYDAITALVSKRFNKQESSVIVSARQRSSVLASIRSLNDAFDCGTDRLEIKSVEVQRAADHVGRITGRIDVEEWLGVIFSRFCIGK